MNAPPSPQHEPTMEEILASIQKIISEDQPEAVAPGPPPSASAGAAKKMAPEPAPLSPQPPALDVLDLTEEVLAPMEGPAAVEEPDPEPENDVVFESVEPEPVKQARPAKEPARDSDELISDSTRHAVGRAFENLHAETSIFPASSGGVLDALFSRAVQDAFRPTLQDWVDGNTSEIMEHLKPLIRQWMDDNLPPLIEAAVDRELSRAAAAAAAAQRPRRR